MKPKIVIRILLCFKLLQKIDVVAKQISDECTVGSMAEAMNAYLGRY
jgi:hypothetical protein